MAAAAAASPEFLAEYRIGSHVGKQKTLTATVAGFNDEQPYQIFLSGPLSSAVKAEAADLETAAKSVGERGVCVFIHSAYVINLSGPKNLETLQQTLRIGAALGARGVVVHVGKAVGMNVSAALDSMRKSIVECLPFATEECPLLLETPAGQGTELLTTWAGFTEFVKLFDDYRLGVCVDTCHVFASGFSPAQYIRDTLEAMPDRIRLVHFNDSQGVCGCRLDRHAFAGTGKLGFAAMQEVAEVCTENGIPMVIE